MAVIADIIGKVLTSAPKCPRPVAEEYLRRSAIEFCTRSSVWTSVLPAVDLGASDFPYAVPPEDADQAVVAKVLSVVVNGLAPGLEEITTLDAETYTDNWRTATGIPREFINKPRGTVLAIPKPESTSSFVFTVAYTPSANATEIPDEVWAVHETAITSGAIAMLAAIPNKPWTSGEMVNLHAGVFSGGVDDAKVDLHLHHKRPLLTTAPSPI